MAPNETSALLKNYREQQTTNSYRSTTDEVIDHNKDTATHIVYVTKDPSEYEPIFSINDYSSALTLDELLPYIIDPWWQNFRRILLLVFWLILIMTFLTACLLSYLELGQTSCKIEKHLLPTDTTSTTLPTTIAKIISTELLSTTSKLPMITVP